MAGRRTTLLDVNTIIKVVEIDLTRVMREVHPMARLGRVRFRVIQSTESKCVFGRDVMRLLAIQDEDMPDPLQSDVDFERRGGGGPQLP